MAGATRNVTLTATLTDSANNPLANQSLDFQHRVQGAAAFTDDGPLPTNASGQATLVLTLASPATYDFQVVYAGVAGQFAAATAQAMGIVVAANVKLSLTAVVN